MELLLKMLGSVSLLSLFISLNLSSAIADVAPGTGCYMVKETCEAGFDYQHAKTCATYPNLCSNDPLSKKTYVYNCAKFYGCADTLK